MRVLSGGAGEPGRQWDSRTRLLQERRYLVSPSDKLNVKTFKLQELYVRTVSVWVYGGVFGRGFCVELSFFGHRSQCFLYP